MNQQSSRSPQSACQDQQGSQGYGDSDGNFLYQQNKIRYPHKQLGDCTRQQIV
jgi:hypothetical protein